MPKFNVGDRVRSVRRIGFSDIPEGTEGTVCRIDLGGYWVDVGDQVTFGYEDAWEHVVIDLAWATNENLVS